jgi:ABC-type amino acid transport substrate-binding protein
MFPSLRVLLICIATAGATGISDVASAAPLNVAVLENSPPMAYRDDRGQLTGFTVEIARAVCAEMAAECAFRTMVLGHVVDALASGEIDIAAVSLLDTPERRRRILFARPYFRSVTLWFARSGVQPGDPGIRVAAVKGSAQEAYSRQQGWNTVAVPTNGELPVPLAAGVAQAALVPMNTSFALLKDPEFTRLGLDSTVMKAPELVGSASFGISPKRPELKGPVDRALEQIELNGVYERINSRFLPFRVR